MVLVLTSPLQFWTKAPLPSISVSDPRYNNLSNANTWSGRPMGLTYQRAIRALERYGHHTEVVLIGQMQAAAILGWGPPGKPLCKFVPANCEFTLEIDPFSAIPRHAPWVRPDGYGPMLLSFLEYTALSFGVVPRAADASMGPLRANGTTLLWSATGEAASNYTQVIGGKSYRLVSDGTTVAVGGALRMSASLNGRVLFACNITGVQGYTAGVRLVTDLSGSIQGVVGIVDQYSAVQCTAAGGAVLRCPSIGANQEYVTASGECELVRSAPYTRPYLH